MKRIIRATFVALIAIEASGSIGFFDLDSDFTWLGLIATLGFIWYLLERFDASEWVWLVALGLLLLDVISAIGLLYSRIELWDRLMHFLGGAGIAAGVLDQVVKALRKDYVEVRHRLRFTFLAVYLAVAAIGYSYEFLEYLVDRLWFGYPKTLVGAYDSVEDQTFNLLGATFVLAIYQLWRYARGRMPVAAVAYAANQKPGPLGPRQERL